MIAGKPHWQIDTDKLAKEIHKAARSARTEEDLKMRVEPLLQAAFRESGIDVDIAQYEKTTALTAKRMDAVYGYLVIEYKGPGKLGSTRSRESAIKQLQTYLEEEARRHGKHPEAFLEKAVGAALDGENIVFIRYSRKPRILPTPVPIEAHQIDFFVAPQQGFQAQGPFPIGPDSLACLLIYVRSAARRPLTAENLAQVFGPDNEVARIAVAELYSAVMRGQRKSAHSRVETFYQEWDRIFGAVYGEKLEKAEQAADETARLYHLPSGVRLKPLLFAIHTYYALLMKLVAYELLALQRDFRVLSFVEGLEAADEKKLRERLSYMESGADFDKMGISNFLEADFFSWYLDTWNPKLAVAVRGMIRALAEFEPATPVLEPDWTRDLLQKLYELIVPKVLRHSLGEYYTPDWLAGYLVDRSGYTGDTAMRFLDPACGSGTFLVQAIQHVVQHAGKQRSRAARSAREDGTRGLPETPGQGVAAGRGGAGPVAGDLPPHQATRRREPRWHLGALHQERLRAGVRRPVRLRRRQPAMDSLGLSLRRLSGAHATALAQLRFVLTQRPRDAPGRRRERLLHALHLRLRRPLSQGWRHARLCHHPGGVQVQGRGRGLPPFPHRGEGRQAKGPLDGGHGAPATVPGREQDNHLCHEEKRGDGLSRAGGGMDPQERRGQDSARVDAG
ncbi:MAG: N-6 DNA methylase [Gammaproteobacteria bacterium]|nr:N-6 DNA methylase [Gammaproteobacteria bacterium]